MHEIDPMKYGYEAVGRQDGVPGNGSQPRPTARSFAGCSTSTTPAPRPSTSSGKRDRRTVRIRERGGPTRADMVVPHCQRSRRDRRHRASWSPELLCHSVGHMLTDERLDTRLIQDFLGYRDIRNTVRYSTLGPLSVGERSGSVIFGSGEVGPG